jgi:7-cyano-7-deazaguanine synthase
MFSYGVTLLSGGLDSTTVTAYAQTVTTKLTALTFYYGQSHSKEVECARRIAEVMGIDHQLLDISFLGQVAWYSALTSPDPFPIPSNRSTEVMGFSIPITYVPLRNTIFLSLAAAYLESRALYGIEVEGLAPERVAARVFMAPNAIDYSGYPDCRPEYYEKIRQALQYGSKLWTQCHIPIEVETPIIHLSKAEIVRWGTELKAPLEYTWSCYQGGPAPCGKCDSCILRAKGFQEAGLPDPLLLRLEKEQGHSG